jgi:hypothetical protein
MNVAGYKINLQKSTALLCTNNEQIEKEYRKIIPLTITSKTIIKSLGINLMKDINDFYKENCKQLKTGYITKSNLHVQHNSHQNPKDIHHRD